jgi:UDP-GlcNAc:undecaprenyl-phosphate/decaprenyl-phosphate GlcNAc-1-phosphate transferase
MGIIDSSVAGVVIVVFLIASCVFSLILNQILLKFSTTLGIRNHGDTIIRWSNASKPALGGISFYILFLISVVAYPLLFEANDYFHNTELLGLIAASSLAFLLGLSDDAYNTKPLLKFLAQVLCAVILIFSGTYIQIFESDLYNYLLTIFWVVAIMNSINMLDNMDAITTVVSICIILAGIFISALSSGFLGVNVFVLCGVLAALLGFLYYNWNPSKMFMGDTGSQFLGLLLSAIAITCLWNKNEFFGETYIIKNVLLVTVAFIIPITDTATVTINRIKNGRSPFVGGKDHTTHHLSYLGLSDRQVAVMYLVISLISFIMVIFAGIYIKQWQLSHFLVFTAYFLIVFITLFSCTHVKKAKSKLDENLRKLSLEK